MGLEPESNWDADLRLTAEFLFANKHLDIATPEARRDLGSEWSDFSYLTPNLIEEVLPFSARFDLNQDRTVMGEMLLYIQTMCSG